MVLHCCDLAGAPDAHAKALLVGLGARKGQLARDLLNRGLCKSIVAVCATAEERALAQAVHADLVQDGRLALLEAESVHDLKHAVVQGAATARLIDGADLNSGIFSLVVCDSVDAVAALSCRELTALAKDAMALLTAGGRLVFAAPHPVRQALQAHAGGVKVHDETGCFNYTSLVDAPILASDDTSASTHALHRFKTLAATVAPLQDAGFELTTVREAAMTNGPRAATYAAADLDVPVALVCVGTKPVSESMNHLESFPKKIFWTRLQMRHPEHSVVTTMPPDAADELVKCVNRLADAGLTHDTVELGSDVDIATELSAVKAYAATVRDRLLEETGAALVKGLDLDKLGERSEAGIADLSMRAKLAYYVFSSLIGRVDAGARGRLFDVKNAKLDVKADNVLFSVTDGEAGWHTDGASRDRVYDVVSLISITPATTGGEFRVANGCNALRKLKDSLPTWLLYELYRPVPRDVMENGAGKGAGVDLVSLVSRSEDVLRMRILRNGYPIFCERGDHLRFRYMRFWIETGFRKAALQLPATLAIAMDALDAELDAHCAFAGVMQPGEMVYSNNMLVAHARNAFKDQGADWAPRHKVRAWLQIRAEQDVKKMYDKKKSQRALVDDDKRVVKAAEKTNELLASASAPNLPTAAEIQQDAPVALVG